MNRRSLGKLLGSGLLLPHVAYAQDSNERNFIFVFADGGWDPCVVFAPLFDNPHADMLPDSDRMEIHGMSLVDSPMRPSVRSFFETYGQDIVVFNGLDLETVSHERGKQILMTGSTQGSDDWGACIAHSSVSKNAHLIVSGPSIPQTWIRLDFCLGRMVVSGGLETKNKASS